MFQVVADRPCCRIWTRVPVGEDEFTADDDLEVTGVVDPHRLLNLPGGGVSRAKSQSRAQVLDFVSSAFASCAVPGAVRTYRLSERVKNIAPKVASKPGCSVLPMRDESSCFAFFGSVALWGPRSAVCSSGHFAVRWSYVQRIKAAGAYSRSVSGIQPVFDSQWSTQMLKVLGR